jgi:hypothetical protein
MNAVNNLLEKGNWYGTCDPRGDIASLRAALAEASAETDIALIITELFKLGDFAAKAMFIQQMNTTKNEGLMNAYIRLFCLVASHQDLMKVENLAFLSDLSEQNADTFASSAVHTLSYEAVPYLLAMLDEWEDTNVEETIRNALDIFLNYSDELDENAAVDEIGQFYLDLMKKVDADQYYYYSTPVFPAPLAKKLIEKSAASRHEQAPLGTHLIPSLLSVWSGINCPVEYNTVVDDRLLDGVYHYVQALSEMDWEAGVKYFYGHPII